MATIKSYTDLSQSKKLAEILPLESADMVIWGRNLDAVAVTDAQKFISGLKDRKMNYLPCWSLAALLGILKDKITFGGASDKEWFVSYTIKNPTKVLFIYKSNLVDACVAMIEKLNELKML